MPKRSKKSVSSTSQSLWDLLVRPDHHLETASVAPVTSAEFQSWLAADLERLEAAWPHVGIVGLARDRMKRAELWPAEVVVPESDAEAG